MNLYLDSGSSQQNCKYHTAGQLTSSEFASFAPEITGRIGSVTQTLVKSDGAGGWVGEEVPFNELNALGHRPGSTTKAAC